MILFMDKLNKPEPPTFLIDRRQVHFEDEVSYLGMKLDEKLNLQSRLYHTKL